MERKSIPGTAARASGSVTETTSARGRLKQVWSIVCRDRHGRIKWQERKANLITNAGLDDMLDKYYKGSAYTAGFFVGLTDGTPTIAAGDTMASHAGWVEVTAYSEGARQTLTLGTVSGQSVDNSASVATFTASGTTTVGGAFLSTNSTKGGTTGILHSAVAFGGGDRSLNASDTLEVTLTATMASA